MLDRIEADGAQEARLMDSMLHGTGNLCGLAERAGVTLIGGATSEGVVSWCSIG